MSKLLIATSNQNKLKEIKELLAGIPNEIISLNDISVNIDVSETGKSYEENAVIKSKTYGNISGILTLADDSGLEIDVLEGRPGIYSARYIEGTDKDREQKILEEMKNIPDHQRTARYKIVISLYDPITKKIKTFAGISEGKITTEPKGKNGFGYDSIFYSFDLEKTYAEANFREKNKVSHRAKAIAKLKVWLTNKGYK